MPSLVSAFESTGGINCFACQVTIPKGLIAMTSGLYDYCPVCAPKRIPAAAYDLAMESFLRQLFASTPRPSHPDPDDLA